MLFLVDETTQRIETVNYILLVFSEQYLIAINKLPQFLFCFLYLQSKIPKVLLKFVQLSLLLLLLISMILDHVAINSVTCNHRELIIGFFSIGVDHLGVLFIVESQPLLCVDSFKRFDEHFIGIVVAQMLEICCRFVRFWSGWDCVGNIHVLSTTF